MEYNELLAIISIVKDISLKQRIKDAYKTDECAKRVLEKTEGDFAIDK